MDKFECFNYIIKKGLFYFIESVNAIGYLICILKIFIINKIAFFLFVLINLISYKILYINKFKL